MSRTIRVGDLAIITVGENSSQFIIREIAPEGIYISATPQGQLSILKYDREWKVDRYQVAHTIRFVLGCQKTFFVSDRTAFKEDLDREFPKVGQEFNCVLTSLPQWDDAQIVWKPIAKGLNWRSMPQLEFFNNLFTTHESLTQKLSLLRTGLSVYGDNFFDLQPYSVELKRGVIPQLPYQYEGLGQTAWITKPTGGFGGEGVKVFWDFKEIKVENEPHILQKYVEKPLLYNGRKFDLRVLVLLTLDEIKVHDFIYARVARLPYVPGTTDQESNITNLSLHGEYDLALSLEEVRISREAIMNFVRRLKPLFQMAQEKEKTFQERSKIKFQTFDLLGLDLIFDQTMKPWLLEINKDPGFRSSRGGIYSQTPRFFSDTLKEAIFFRLFPGQRTPTGYTTI